MEYSKPTYKCLEYGICTKLYNRWNHRFDGPSFVWHYLGDIDWHVYGQAHRIDGPLYTDGLPEYFIHNIEVTRTTQEHDFHNETTKLGPIESFIDFIARCDIILL